MTTKMSVDDAVLTLAASVVDRTAELLADGWVKGRLNGGHGNVEEFCIHGALSLALEEVFGDSKECGRVYVCGGAAAMDRGRGDIEAIAAALIVDEAANRFGYNANAWRNGSLAAAPFNDAAERKHDEVLSTVRGAAHRLWDLALDSDQAASVQVSWAQVDEEVAQQYLHVSLAN